MIKNKIINYFLDDLEIREINYKSNSIRGLIHSTKLIKILREKNKSLYIKSKNKAEYNKIVYTIGLKTDFKAMVVLPNDKVDSYRLYHKHDYVEVIYVLKGNFEHEINGDIVKVKQTEGCILNTTIEHKNSIQKEDDIVLILCVSKRLIYNELKEYIKGNFLLDRLLNSYNYIEKPIGEYISFKANKSIEELLLALVHEEKNRCVGSRAILLGYTKRLLHNITYDSLEVKLESANKEIEVSVFERISKYIDDNISTISRDKIAKKISL